MKRFTVEETQIFTYYNGEKMVAIDPIDAAVKLQKEDFEWEHVGKLCETGDVSAINDLVNHVRKIMGLSELVVDDEGKVVSGVSSTYVLEVLMELVKFMDGLKKNTEDSVITAPSTEAETK